jgi:hypothetical protein
MDNLDASIASALRGDTQSHANGDETDVAAPNPLIPAFKHVVLVQQPAANSSDGGWDEMGELINPPQHATAAATVPTPFNTQSNRHLRGPAWGATEVGP